MQIKNFNSFHYILQEDYAAASAHLKSCLQALGRPLPTTKFDLMASLFWNLLRQLLHRVYVGRWLSRRAGRLCGGITCEDACKSARDACVVYHKLHQLHLTGHAKQSTLSGINLGLCTLNMAEAAGSTLASNLLAEMYATNAITARVHYPKALQFLTVSNLLFPSTNIA